MFSSFPSFLETLLYIFHGVLLLYGATLFLKAKYASQVIYLFENEGDALEMGWDFFGPE